MGFSGWSSLNWMSFNIRDTSWFISKPDQNHVTSVYAWCYCLIQFPVSIQCVCLCAGQSVRYQSDMSLKGLHHTSQCNSAEAEVSSLQSTALL